MAEQLCISHFKEEYVAQGERERRRFSQPLKQQPPFSAIAQHSHHHSANSATESDTATETDSETDKVEPARAAPRRFTDSQLSASGTGTAKPIPVPSKREWQRASPAAVAQSNHANHPKRKKDKPAQRHWADDTSPRGSKVGSITESLVAENGESYAGFDDGGPGALPGTYPVGGSSSKPVGNKRVNSMPSESGASTATTRVL